MPAAVMKDTITLFDSTPPSTDADVDPRLARSRAFGKA